jgi:uncharacterized protein YmfQ (DUF2313 family)
MDSVQINDLLRLKKQLLPNGRAFACPSGSDFEKLLLGFCESEKIQLETALRMLDSLIPDNTNFTLEDCEIWERIFGIIINSDDIFEARKLRILQLMSFPNNQLARQNYRFIEKQLRDAGFDIYVHEFINVESHFGFIEHSDDTEHGDDTIEHGAYTVPAYESIISDFIDKNRERGGGFSLEQLRSCFFISASTFPNYANIPATQEANFRQLILKLKPVHTVGFLMINYI